MPFSRDIIAATSNSAVVDVAVTGVLSTNIVTMPEIVLSGTQTITLGSAAYDAYGRQRMASPSTLFASQLDYADNTLLWDTSITAGGSSSYYQNESTFDLFVGTTSGDKIVRQTKQYFKYQPGACLLVAMTFVLGAQKANVQRRVGFFDDENGIFLQQTNAGNAFVLRNFISGTANDDPAAQANWSIDTFDGTGPSGVTLNLAYAQILVIDLQWLGAGLVRCGFIIDGVIHYAHHFVNANKRASVYMTTARLPVRYELVNTDTAASSSTLRQICAAVTMEGGVIDPAGQLFSADNGITARPALSTVALPLIAIRPVATFASATNRRSTFPLQLLTFATVKDVFLYVLLNPTLTSGSWVTANSASHTEYNVTATAATGGIKLLSGDVAAGKNSNSVGAQQLLEKVVLTNNLTTQDTLALMGRGIGGTSTTYSSITWKEI